MARQPLPIVVMSFNRPAMLTQVLQSLKRQSVAAGFDPRPYLLQDGGVSALTGRRYADDADLDASVAAFRHLFPAGRVLRSAWNLGVAMNFDRAERLVFEDLGADAALFLEDDMVLQPSYLHVMSLLADLALADARIGMVSAYGHDIGTPLSEQRRRRRELRPMGEHNWAFLLTAACWRARDAVIAPYLELIRGIDYRDRGEFKPQIEAFQSALGRIGDGYLSSQDSIKNLACEALGLWRLTTFTNNSRYIGASGEHMTAERFEARGYARTILYDGPHDGFVAPDADAMRRWSAAARCAA